MFRDDLRLGIRRVGMALRDPERVERLRAGQRLVRERHRRNLGRNFTLAHHAREFFRRPRRVRQRMKIDNDRAR